jgi:arylamine N-acetyltransferase
MNESMPSSLIDLYRSRLDLPLDVPLAPTFETLALLTERHLEHIPFENISMHLLDKVADEPIVSLNRDKMIHKLLIRRRGGCCLELNGLMQLLLQDLGYQSVTLVPCWVYAGPERGHQSKKCKFRVQQTHFFLLVKVENGEQFMVDVGIGEPCLHPLRYGASMLGEEQMTPEGMKSRIVWDPRGPWKDGQGRKRQCLLLEWWLDDLRGWEPRLQWDVTDAPLDCMEPTPGPSLQSFQHVIPILTHEMSSFARKLIVCKLTRNKKVSLSGRILKITSPRLGPDSKQDISGPFSEEDVYALLETEFGIVLAGGDRRLNLAHADNPANNHLWKHL